MLQRPLHLMRLRELSGIVGHHYPGSLPSAGWFKLPSPDPPGICNKKESEQMQPGRHRNPALLRLQQDYRLLSPQPELLAHAAHPIVVVRLEAMLSHDVDHKIDCSGEIPAALSHRRDRTPLRRPSGADIEGESRR